LNVDDGKILSYIFIFKFKW